MNSSALILALALAGPAASGEQPADLAMTRTVAVCPPENADTRAMVNRFMTSSSFAATRQQLGLGTLGASEVRLLTDTSDSGACTTLKNRVQLTPRRYPRIATYYRVGGVYLVATTQVVPPNETYITWHPLYVLDTAFALKDAFAM